MTVKETYLQGCFIIEPTIFRDDRGSFFESFNQQEFQKKAGININFVQDNQSISQRGVIRGLHFQEGEFSQAKLVNVIKGKVLDVVVDIRPSSKTYGENFSVILSGENNKQLFVPRGFAHGFAALENGTIFSYKCDSYYNKESERGIIYNDLNLGIDWMLPENEITLSEKDKQLPTLEDLVL